jgi:hypothetical protein
MPIQAVGPFNWNESGRADPPAEGMTTGTGAGPHARANRKISPKNRKIIGRLGFVGFQPEMRGAALARFDKQFPFDQIKEVSMP